MATVLYIVIMCCALQEPGAFTIDGQAYETLVKSARGEYWSGRFVQSEALFLRALRMLPSSDETRRARTLTDLGDVYVNEDQLQKAEHVYLESLAIYKKAADRTKVTLLLRNLGAVYSLQRREDEAVRVLQQALKIARAASQPDATLISEVLNSLGVEYYRERNMTKAEKFLTEAVQVLPDPDGLSGRVDLLNNLGAVYQIRRENEKAEQYFMKALKVTEAQVGPAHPDLTFSLSLLAILYTDTGQYAKAEEQFQRALAILDLNKSVFETRIARLLDGLSRTYARAGRKDEAEAALSRATAIARRHVAEHIDMTVIMETYAATLQKNGRAKQAEELRGEAQRARTAAGLVVSVHNAF